MGIELTLLWIIASIMSCWCFSVIVRTLSDWVATKRKRLAPQYNKKSKWIALAVFVLCAATAYFTASYAIELESEYSYDATGISTPIGIVSASVCVFAGFLIVWGLIGDRARGRIRCPRCWYDMSAAQNLTCPECGNEAKNQRAFTKSRRPKWPFVLAAFFLSTGGYTFSVSQRVVDTGEWLAVVPTWFLMLGWERLPENWIYNNWDSNAAMYYSCLEDRLESSSGDWGTTRQNAWFGNRLLRGMLTSPEDRWDPIRIALVQSASHDMTHNSNNEWKGLPLKTDELYKLSAADMIDAVTTSNPSKLHIRIMELMEYGDESNPYSIARNLIREKMIQQDEEIDYKLLDKQTVQYCSELLHDFKHTIRSDGFKLNLIHNYDGRNYTAYTIAIDSGITTDLYAIYFDSCPHEDHSDLRNRSFALAMLTQGFSDEELNEFFRFLTERIRTDDPDTLLLALNTLTFCQRLTPLNSRTPVDEYHEAVQAALDARGRSDDLVDPSEDWYTSVQELVLRIISHDDMSGIISFPLISEQLKVDPSLAPNLYFIDSLQYEIEVVGLWIEYFGEFVNSTDPEVQNWIISNLPEQLGSEFDEQIDQIAVRFLDHPDEDLRELAEYKLKARLADFLIDH